MPVTIPEKRPPARPPFWKRLGWFVLLYAGGVAVTALVAYGLKLWIKP